MARAVIGEDGDVDGTPGGVFVLYIISHSSLS